ncbi:MAG: beta-galactosidase [Spirochaetales bacterium]|nr:beta-galactosidase [Spirochaetales bacterium]
MNSDVISYDGKGFIVHGKREFLIGGEFHYFRIPAEQWEDRLNKMANTGANLISVYVPWNLHEPLEGKERWTGDYDLERFLNLCEKYGFFIIIKPGPYICAELDFGGHPDWLIKKIADGEIELRKNEKGYLSLCRRWYKRVSEYIVPRQITRKGRIIAIQIENEYDHLIEYGEDDISFEDAVNYFLNLKKMMEDLDIDIPKFANEGAFLRGKGIIDTRTYYPNIPGLWFWEFSLFENKIIESRQTQPDVPVMIMELQAGWFAQIGSPIYEVDRNLLSAVSKSVLIQGASLLNYYMMAGGTTFPFIGARGDIFFFGGLGNITSYDFGGAPVGETGEVHHDKYHWIKGFIRFALEFRDIILNSDEEKHVTVLSGGENILYLTKGGVVQDKTLDKSGENFAVFEKGNEDGRFFYIRNLEKDDHILTCSIPGSSQEQTRIFKVNIPAREIKMLPVLFKIPGTPFIIFYSTSEVYLSRKYASETVFILSGKTGSEGELCLNAKKEKIRILKGDVNIDSKGEESVLSYKHEDIIMVKLEGSLLLIVDENMLGRIEELSSGLLFHDAYYIENIVEKKDQVHLAVQMKESADSLFRFLPLPSDTCCSQFIMEGKNLPVKQDKKSSLNEIRFTTGAFPDKPEVRWTSDWHISADTEESSPDYKMSGWQKLDKPVSLEEAGFFEHGYYWFRTEFKLESEPEEVFIDYSHNNTDRMFIFLNGKLIYKSHNRKLKRRGIIPEIKTGKNTMAILYANEFHNKSHPHEGDLVKYSGILNPFHIYGKYKNGKALDLSVGSFYVRPGLSGILQGYHTLDFDDSSWMSFCDGLKFVPAREMGYLVWFRRKFRYDLDRRFSAPLLFRTDGADQRLTVYVNGRAVARYDILGPQEEFYIPEAYLNNESDNILAVILECPAFYDEWQSGYRRGYLYAPQLKPAFVAKKMALEIKV